MAVDELPVTSATDLLDVFENHEAGDEVVLKVLRDESEKEINVVLESTEDATL